MSQFHPLILLSRRAESPRAQVLEFAVPGGLSGAFRPEPGQHVVLRASPAGAELRRTYSVCAHSPERFQICVRSDGAGRMASWLCTQLQPGQSVDALAPTGRFVLSQATSARNILCLAAGIGITPIIAIVRGALRASADTQVTLLYGSRSTEDTLFAEELQALKDQYPARLALHFFMSREPQDTALYDGRIDGTKIRDLVGTGFPAGSIDGVFLCAPEALMQEAQQCLLGMGIPAARIHQEHFVAAAAGTAHAVPAPAAAPAAKAAATQSSAPDAAARTRVTVRMDGRVRHFDMPREGEQTVLEAAEEAGLDLPFSCKGGVCSTCRCHAARGTVRMLQNYALEDAEVEAGYILTCQSIPGTAELELDYDRG